MGKKGQNRGKGKQFGNTDCDSLSKQLRQNGFTVVEVLGDGNCLFRALGHQYEGHCRNHIQFRKKVVEYIQANRKEFEPFIEDGKFEDHVQNLSDPGTYGGNDSIVAFSRLYKCTIVIHQFNCPAWVVHSPVTTQKQLHISYHNGDHYNSVVKLNGAVELTPQNQPNSTSSDGGTNSKAKKNNDTKNPKSKPSEKPLTTELHLENLKITDDTENEKDQKKKIDDTPKPAPQNKPKNLSRRQKLDQKKKERKQESMQRKRGGSFSETPKPTINFGITPIVKTLNI